jgi:hypothetical protein
LSAGIPVMGQPTADAWLLELLVESIELVS